ncbi:MAG TPA: thioesterase domain-containing protein [Pseudonocardiaceae bacterium]|nr:thioesterase domain-containing protein [Pseudonocardiaceae bacterium]
MLTQAQRAVLAARLRQGRTTGTQSSGNPIVQLNDGPAQRPLVVFHALGGTVYPYGHLARDLTGDFQVYGVLAPHGEPDAEGSLDALVARHLRVLRRIVPTGPYRLAGWSMGGVLAFEIARRLAPDEVAFVGLLDAPFWLPDDPEPDDQQFAGLFVADAARSLGPAQHTRPDPDTTSVNGQLRWLAGQLDSNAEPEQLLPELQRRYAAFRVSTRVLAGYRPSGLLPADGLIIDVEESPNTSRLWRDVLLGSVRMCSLEGNHYSFLQPPLVSRVSALLRETDRQALPEFDGGYRQVPAVPSRTGDTG